MGSEAESHQFKNDRIMAQDQGASSREAKVQFVHAPHSIDAFNCRCVSLCPFAIENPK